MVVIGDVWLVKVVGIGEVCARRGMRGRRWRGRGLMVLIGKGVVQSGGEVVWRRVVAGRGEHIPHAFLISISEVRVLV